MQSLSLHPSSTQTGTTDFQEEIARLEARLAEARHELSILQEEMRAFKARYTEIVGGPLAELSEVEREIKEAEARCFGVEVEDEEETAAEDRAHPSHEAPTVRRALRKLFWAAAKMFHPDHARDEREAERRHTIMAEASRAYREGDITSLHTLLGDEHLQSLCAVKAHSADDADEDAQLLRLEVDLRTVEFGIKRLKQDGLYYTKLKVDEEATHGRDALAQMAEQLNRQIAKARHRLAHLS